MHSVGPLSVTGDQQEALEKEREEPGERDMPPLTLYGGGNAINKNC